jgi:hypothetical protein
MTLYELLFILLFLGSVAGLGVSLLLRKSSGRRILCGLSAIWAVYFAILGVTDALRAQKTFKAGEDECFDEMCFAVTGAVTLPSRELDPAGSDADVLYVVTTRVASHARGRAQAEGAIRARLYAGGKYFAASESAQRAYEAQHGSTPGLRQKIAAGETISSVLVFEVPKETAQPALTLDHGFTPGYFVIGESPFFHQPPIHELPLPR